MQAASAREAEMRRVVRVGLLLAALVCGIAGCGKGTQETTGMATRPGRLPPPPSR
jgi:hypothetical protein